jgi:hypothetical protein
MATVISCLRQSPRARCLTLTLAPNGAGPGCCSGLRTSRSQPFRYPRARFHPPPRANAFMPDHTLGCSMFARGSGIKKSAALAGSFIERLVAALLDLALGDWLCPSPASQSRPLRLVGDRRVAPNPLPRAWAVLAPVTARTSALFRLRPSGRPDSGTDLPAFRPLHSLPHSASRHRQDALARSAGRKLARQSRTARAHPMKPMAARLRPAKTPALAVSPTSFHYSPVRLAPAFRETGRPHSPDKISLRLRRQAAIRRSRQPRLPLASPARTFALPSKTQKFWLRAVATAPGTESSKPGTRPSATRWVGMNEQPTLRFSLQVFAPRLGVGFASGNADNTYCAFVPSFLSHYFILIAPTILTREPLWGGIKLRTIWRCLHCRCFTVTLTADPHLASVRAVSAPACRHRSRQPTAPLGKDQPGLLAPKPPPIPNARPLPSPRGRR